MFSVTSKPPLDRGVPFAGISDLWHSFFRNSLAGCDSLLLTVTFVWRDCQRKPIAVQRENWLLCHPWDMHLASITRSRFLCLAVFSPGRYLMMGTERGFVRHQKVSSSLDFPPGKSDEQKKDSSWLCLLFACVLYSPATEAGTWLIQLFLLWRFPANRPFGLFWSIHLSVYYIIILQYHLEVPDGIRALHSRCSRHLSSGR